jgi:hypothetical protein
MKKTSFFVTLILGLISFHFANAQRENWFPNKGNVGIGTRDPQYTLHIIGNLKVTEEIIGKSLQIENDIQANDLQIRRNAIILSKLGIGVANPIENFELNGNAKISGNLTAAGVTFQSLNSTSATFNNLTVNQNSILNGPVGIGIASPTEKLHVAGNIKADNTLIGSAIQTGTFAASGTSTFSDNIIVYKNAIVNGKIGLGVVNPSEVLDILGNIKTSGSLTSASIQSGAGQLASLSVSNNSLFSGSIGIGVTSPEERLHLSGNIRTDGTVYSKAVNTTQITASDFTTGTASFSDNVSLAKDVMVTGKVGIGTAAPSESLEVKGNIKSSGIVQSPQLNVLQANVTQDLVVGGNTTVAGDLQVTGQFVIPNISPASVTTTSDVTVGKDLRVTGATQLAGDVTMPGNITTGNIISGNISSGDISAGIVEATEFRTKDGSSPFNFENTVVKQTLAVATELAVPANYKLAVGGNIIATGIDVKIPSKWPDYVFTDEYGLISLAELADYIKKNGHLPKVPSAKEMEEKQNYSLSEMDGKLLEKVEELTLYVIQLKKEIDALKKAGSNK